MECEINDNSPAPMNPRETRTNLIINHLPNKLTEDEFQDIFKKVGTIKSLRIMKDLKTGASFGFGFVEYDEPESAARAILQLNNYAIQNKRLKVSYAQPPGEDPSVKDTNIYIQNLPKDYSLEQLEALFLPFGEISQKLIFKDKNTGVPRGVAFVRFKRPSEAYAAIQGMDKRIPDGGHEPLLVKIAKDRANKKNDAFQAGFQAGLARGRGRGQFNNRGGFGRNVYNDMGMGRGSNGGGGFSHSPSDYMAPDYGPGGKIGQDRSNNRYNPIGSGGGYPNSAYMGPYNGGGGVPGGPGLYDDGNRFGGPGKGGLPYRYPGPNY